MGKNYKQWHKLKTRIESGHKLREFSEREIWWCSVGYNIGVEEDGKNFLFERPVLVFKKFNNQMLWVLPLTSQIKNGVYFFSVSLAGIKRTIILSQLRLVSVKRLTRKIGRINKREYHSITRSIIRLIKKAP